MDVDNKLLNWDYVYPNWIDQFYETIAKEDKNKGFEQPTIMLIEEMRVLEKNLRLSDVWKCYDELIRHTSKPGSFEQLGRVEAICAGYDVKYGRLPIARERLNDAIMHNLSDEHFVAVMHWLLGIVFWLNDKSKWDAFFEWNASKTKFDALARSSKLGKGTRDWYQARVSEIDECIKSIDDEKLKVAAAQPAVETASTRPVATKAPKKKSAASQSHLQLYQIFPPTSAGPWSPRINSIDGYIDVTEIQINQERFEVRALYNDNRINVLPLNGVFAVQVIGDSMNNFPIISGDYVLIDPNRTKPVTGDVVFVESNEFPDEKDTIKRYHDDGDYAIFEPVSTFDLYSKPPYPFIIPKGDAEQRYRIIGTAIARLTRKPDED